MIRRGMLLAVVSLVLTLPNGAICQDKQGGTAEVITVTTPSGAQEFVFRYCPPGKIAKDIDDSEEAETTGALAGLLSKHVNMGEFYLLEKELSVAQFAAVLGEQHFDDFVQDISQMAESNPVVYGDFLAPLKEKSVSNPVMPVWLDDASLFCDKLKQLAQTQLLPATTIESYEFRLPSIHEWRYAAVAVNDASSKQGNYLFNYWPTIDQYTKNERVKLNAVLNSIDPTKWPIKEGGLERMLTQTEFENLMLRLKQSPNRDAIDLMILFLATTIYDEDVDLTQPRDRRPHLPQPL